MRKHLSKTILLTALCLLLTGCGQNGQSSQSEGVLPDDPPAGQEQQAETSSSEEADHGIQLEEAEDQAYTDNFSVEQADAEDFARKIQTAVADKDLDELADLMMFPNYVGFPEDPQFVDTREDFLALGADRVFTEDLLTEVSTADISALEPSQAGFILSASGCPNVVFGVSDGHLAIVGINY